MNSTTTGICLMALLVSYSMNGVLRADELVRRGNFFAANEHRHQWINERNGRTGQLLVSGSLVSSPCTLETNEVMLLPPESNKGITMHYALEVNLQGCGNGGKVTSDKSRESRDSMTVMQSVLLTGGGLQPDQWLVSAGPAAVYDGANRFTYWLSDAQQQVLVEQQKTNCKQGKTYMNPRDSHALLHLRLDYE
ncbi:TPA: pilus-assembly fibrillin subunit [Escherichia coli]